MFYDITYAYWHDPRTPWQVDDSCISREYIFRTYNNFKVQIDAKFFNNIEDAKDYRDYLESSGYKYLGARRVGRIDCD